MTLSQIPASRRKIVRYWAAALALVTSLTYFLIGLQLLAVLDNPGDQTAFGLIAGSAFLLGAFVIMLTDNRVVMGLGAVAQAWIIFMYFNLAPDREPSYEIWGILIRVVQLLLLGALVYLAIRPRAVEVSDNGRSEDDVETGSGQVNAGRSGERLT